MADAPLMHEWYVVQPPDEPWCEGPRRNPPWWACRHCGRWPCTVKNDGKRPNQDRPLATACPGPIWWPDTFPDPWKSKDDLFD